MNIQDMFYGRMLDMLLWTKAITVSQDFHTQCGYVDDVISNDITGIVNTILDYAINSASSANYKIECSNQVVEDILNKWLSSLNDELLGTIPTGTSNLAKEYFQELWKGSSLCVLRAKDWKEVDFSGNKILVPKALYFANGSSIYVDRPDTKNFKLGSDKYYLDSSKSDKMQIPNAKEEIIIQKNGTRWHDEYPIPYLVRNGIYKNHKALQVLSDKGDEVITKALPYLFLLTMGSESMANAGINYKVEDLKKFQTEFKADLEKYKGEKGKLPALVDTWDKKYSHLIPDFRPILSQDLFVQGYRAILAGLGFIDLLEISISRQETRLNPKPFISNVNAGVDGFKSILTDLAKLIIIKNIESHRKLFSENNEITVVASPLRINTEQILDIIRSGFDRGSLSIRTFIESMGFDYETEMTRRQKELDEGIEDLMYPHLLQNREDIPDRMGIPAKPKNDKNLKNKTGPEKQNFKAELEEKLIAKCKKCGHEFDYLSVQEAGMGYVKCPKCEEAVTQEDLIDSSLKEDLEIAPYTKTNYPSYLNKYPEGARNVWISTWNSVYEKTHDEAKAFKIAWSALQKYMNKLKEDKK